MPENKQAKIIIGTYTAIIAAYVFLVALMLGGVKQTEARPEEGLFQLSNQWVLGEVSVSEAQEQASHIARKSVAVDSKERNAEKAYNYHLEIEVFKAAIEADDFNLDEFKFKVLPEYYFKASVIELTNAEGTITHDYGEENKRFFEGLMLQDYVAESETSSR